MSKIRKTAVVAALSAAALFTGTQSALAMPNSYIHDSGWDYQLGPTGSGCYFWTTYSLYMVQPHAWQQGGNYTDTCTLRVSHTGYNADGIQGYFNILDPQTTTGPATGFDGPDWYYGPWNNGGHMCVSFDLYDSYGYHLFDTTYC